MARGTVENGSHGKRNAMTKPKKSNGRLTLDDLKSDGLTPMQRELVRVLDSLEYDDLRTMDELAVLVGSTPNSVEFFTRLPLFADYKVVINTAGRPKLEKANRKFLKLYGNKQTIAEARAK